MLFNLDLVHICVFGTDTEDLLRSEGLHPKYYSSILELNPKFVFFKITE